LRSTRSTSTSPSISHGQRSTSAAGSTRALAGAFNAQGRFDEGDAILRRLAAKARTDGDRVDVARGRATSLGGSGRLADAETMLADLRAQISEETAHRELDMIRCFVAAQGGPIGEAITGLLPLLADEQAELDRRVEAASVLASGLAVSGRFDESLSLIAESEPFLTDGGDLTRRRGIPLAMLAANFHEGVGSAPISTRAACAKRLRLSRGRPQPSRAPFQASSPQSSASSPDFSPCSEVES
jgi:hypothetical protein